MAEYTPPLHLHRSVDSPERLRPVPDYPGQPPPRRTKASTQEQLAEIWDAMRLQPGAQWETLRALAMLDAIGAHDHSARVLDLQCRNGYLLRLGFDPGHYDGIDSSPTMITQARADFGHLRADFRRMHLEAYSERRPQSCAAYTHVFALFSAASQLLGRNQVWHLLNAFAPGTKFLLVFHCNPLAGDSIYPVRNAWAQAVGARIEAEALRHWTVDGLREELDAFNHVVITGFNRCMPIARQAKPWEGWLNLLGEHYQPNRCKYLVAAGVC